MQTLSRILKFSPVCVCVCPSLYLGVPFCFVQVLQTIPNSGSSFAAPEGKASGGIEVSENHLIISMI